MIRRLLARILPENVKVRLRYILIYWLKEKLAKRKTFRIYSGLVLPGDLVFDVGANIGTMTKMFLKLGAKVVCVEPNPSCIEILKKRFGSNRNVTIVGKGVCEKEGKLDFFICEKANEVSTFSKRWKKGRYSYLQWDKRITVPVTTLNGLIKMYGTPKFCKMDVEGYELNVLKGLKSAIPYISFEFHKEFLGEAKKCADILSRIGKTKFNFFDHERQELNPRGWLDQRELFSRLESNTDKGLRGDIYAKMAVRGMK